MKVLFLNNYYKPERTSGAHITEDLRVCLAQKGHTMQIFAPTPTRGVSDSIRKKYKKEKKKEIDYNGLATVRRFSMFREGKNVFFRAIRYFFVEFKLLLCGLFCKKADIIPMSSTPPINGLVATIIKKIRKIPFVYTIDDLFPDSLVSSGLTPKNSILWKLGYWVSEVTYKNAAHIITITDGIKNKLIERGIEENKITVIHNWIDLEKNKIIMRESNTIFDEFGFDRNDFYLTYAGNIGNSQNVEILIDCAERLKQYENIKIIIFGDGTQRDKLVKRASESNLKNLKILPMQPQEKVSEVYSLGDASFVICKKGVGIGAFPSKAASIMASGTAVIASFDLDSDLCKLINEYKAGICVDSENVQGLVDAILKLYFDKSRCDEYSKNARFLAESIFSKEICIAKRIEIYEKYSKKY